MAESTIKNLKIDYVEKSVTVPAGANADAIATLPSNALCTAGFTIYGTGSAVMSVYGCYKDGTTAYVRMASRGAQSFTVTARIYYLAL